MARDDHDDRKFEKIKKKKRTDDDQFKEELKNEQVKEKRRLAMLARQQAREKELGPLNSGKEGGIIQI